MDRLRRTMVSRRYWWTVVLTGLVLLAGVAWDLNAQVQTPVNRALATREDLEAALAAANQKDRQKLSNRDRAILEERLEEGDFRMGDRVFVTIQSDKIVTDTFTVLTGQGLTLPDMDTVQLHGVLRSELQQTLQNHVSKYIRTPNVKAEALLRVGVLGAVNRPGYYSVRADLPVGDLPMVATGLAGDADLKKVQILRDGKEYWPRDDVRRAMASGQSVDLMGLKGGDEFVVGRRGAGLGPTLLILTGIASLATTVILLAR